MSFKEKWANLDTTGKWIIKVFVGLVLLSILYTAAQAIF